MKPNMELESIYKIVKVCVILYSIQIKQGGLLKKIRNSNINLYFYFSFEGINKQAHI